MMEIVPEPEGLTALPPLVSAEAVEAWTEGELAQDDPRLDLLIGGASTALRRYAGWHVAPVVRDTVTVTDHYGGGRLDVLVPSSRVRDVTGVRVDGRAVTGYAWDEDGAVWAGTLSSGPHRIEVDLEHGYHLSEVADLASVVVQVVAVAASSPKGATRERAGQVSIDWAQTAIGVAGGLTLLERDLAIVDRYRIGGAP